MLNKFKYWLLRRLMDDMCKNCKGHDEDCVVRLRMRYDGEMYYTLRDQIFMHAEKVWRIK